jgi:SAM-dependent methyltransferase
MPASDALYGSGWDIVHPFDRTHGTHTSGFMASSELPADSKSRAGAVFYAGSQPSVMRKAFASLPNLAGFCFIDLGCGKGRALFVATEFPFASIHGVELSPELSDIARSNATLFAKRHPERMPVQVTAGDALEFPFPPGNLAIFLSNPFDATITA